MTYLVRRWRGPEYDQILVYRTGEDRPFLSLRIEKEAMIETELGSVAKVTAGVLEIKQE